MLVGASPRRVAIVGGVRIPFVRGNGAYSQVGNQDMLTAALRGVVERYGLQGQRLDEVGAGAMNRHRAHARRSREEIVGQFAARDDAIRVVRQTPDGRVIAVRGANHLGRAREQLLAGRRDRIDDQNAVHQ